MAFKRPMVVAILGDLKTITRRVMPQQPIADNGDGFVTIPTWFHGKKPVGRSQVTVSMFCTMAQANCRYQPGDILLVKEAAWMWCEKVPDGLTPTRRPKFRYVPIVGKRVYYVADGGGKPQHPMDGEPEREYCWRQKIPRFLPKWAVRTRLKVVSVRVERLQEITEADAKAEGLRPTERAVYPLNSDGRKRPCSRCGQRYHAHIGKVSACPQGMGTCFDPSTYRDGFAFLWESINGPGSWDENPFVYRIEFKRLP